MPLATGQMLNNRYRIVKLLGQGGFGAVYKAWDTNLEEPVALKESFETSAAAQKQFQLEAKLLFKLRHASLPRVHDFFVIAGQGMYLVMDYIEGEDMGKMLERAGGALPEAQVLPWMRQVCEALSYLHSQQPPVIHRDIKPANIKITPTGEAMLVDFGIAKVFDANLRTTAGARAVTPGYSPQEQYGMGATDARTDVYALGATLYHLLTGVQPPESIQRNLGAELAPPRSLNRAISAQVEAAVLTALAMQPGGRFQSMADFKAALAAPDTAPVQAISTPLPRTQVMPYDAAAGAARIGQVSPAAGGQTPMQGGAAPAATTGRIPSAPTWPWKWIAGGVGLLAVAALVISGIIAAFSGGAEERQATQSAAALETQTQRTELAGELVATQKAAYTLVWVTFDAAVRQTELALIPTQTPKPEDSATSTALLPTITDSKGVTMNLIPAGSFLMGSESGEDDEKPVHEVYLDAFYIDVYEVTNELYAACVAAGVCSAPSKRNSSTRDSYYGDAQYAQYPVIYFSWNDAVEYCEWRGARLPTEAEWEKAARGGLEGKQYPWGDEDPDCSRANSYNNATRKNCVGDTSQVGSYAQNSYGLYDMAGNVWEWVQDQYGSSYYSSQSTWNNPTGPASGTYRVLRGGGWHGSWHYLRSADRNIYPEVHDSGIGFRCGVSAPGR